MTTGGVKDPTKATADSLHNKDEWDVAIQSLQAYQETIGTDIQTKMVYVQDFMGQYNFIRRARTRLSSPVCRRLPPWLAGQ